MRHRVADHCAVPAADRHLLPGAVTGVHSHPGTGRLHGLPAQMFPTGQGRYTHSYLCFVHKQGKVGTHILIYVLFTNRAN